MGKKEEKKEEKNEEKKEEKKDEGGGFKLPSFFPEKKAELPQKVIYNGAEDLDDDELPMGRRAANLGCAPVRAIGHLPRLLRARLPRHHLITHVGMRLASVGCRRPGLVSGERMDELLSMWAFSCHFDVR